MNKNIIDKLVYQAVFGSDSEKQESRYKIYHLALDRGLVPSSINDFYMARGKNLLPQNVTVPAINARGMAYDLSRAIFKVAKKLKVGALIIELARSEMGYTDQPPHEYTCVIMAAALREDWTGPLFIQGDHFQAKVSSPGNPKAGEVDSIKELIKNAISAGFYNIDIDMSTLVNLDRTKEKDQQESNIRYSLDFAKFIRSLEPKGVTISLGAEIGHIGGKNSTVEDFRAFMSGFNASLPRGTVGISKISVQTGTSHGGVVLPDGSLADIDVDFSILKNISQVGRKEYGIGGAVQHGASTLPDEYFGQFTKSEALEVHLATGFQNIQYDHSEFPKSLLNEIYSWLDENKQDERKQNQTDEQFHYKLRKKAWGQFKKQTWHIPEDKKRKIRSSLSDRFAFLFKELNVIDSVDMVETFVKPVKINKSKEDFFVDKPKD